MDNEIFLENLKRYKKALKMAGFGKSSIYKRGAAVRSSMLGDDRYTSNIAVKDFNRWLETGEVTRERERKTPKEFQLKPVLPVDQMDVPLGELFGITNRKRKLEKVHEYEDWVFGRDVSYIGPSGAVWK